MAIDPVGMRPMLSRKCTGGVDADLSKYFDSIPHSALLTSVARRIVDRHVLRLIKMWLKVPVEERSGDGKRRMSGGKSNTRGTPQGGVVRPMVVVLKLTRFRGHPNTCVQGAHDGEDKTTLHTGIPWPDGRAGTRRPLARGTGAVLGAGASNSLDFPTGVQLAQMIVNNFKHAGAFPAIEFRLCC
jgi:hypothetical protein